MNLFNSKNNVKKIKELKINYKNKNNEENCNYLKYEEINHNNLFSNVDNYDYLLKIFGILSSIIVGIDFPIYTYFVGKILDISGNYIKYEDFNNNQVRLSLKNGINEYLYYIIIVGALTTIFTFFYTSVWKLIACIFIILLVRKANDIQLNFFKSFIHQDIEWYEKNDKESLSSITDQFNLLDNLGFGLSCVIQSSSQIICAYIIGFIMNWKLAIINLAVSLPVALISFCFIGLIINYFKKV